MSWIRGLGQRLRVVLRFSRVESELDQELREHLALEVERQLQQGLPLDEAKRRAILRVGHVDALKEEVRDERGGRFVTDAIGDLRIGWRGLRRNPGFTLAVVLSLALGAGGATAIFTVVQAVLLRPLPYPESERLYQVRVAWGDFTANLSVADLLRVREQQGGVADIGAFGVPSSGFTMLTDAGPEVIQGATVTLDLPRVLGVPPVIGRWPAADRNEAPEALIGTDLWRQRFGGSADVVGRRITLDGVSYTIAGVMPPGYNVPGQADGAAWTVWRPDEPTRRGPFIATMVARLAPGVSADAAGARLTAAVTPILRDRYPDPNPSAAPWRYRVDSWKTRLVGDITPTLWLLFATVGLVLLIAIVNVANLLLARGTARARELAVRASLGAGRGRLVRQLLAESALVGLLAGIAGLGLTFVVLDVTSTAARTIVPRMQEVRIDATVTTFALAIGIIAGLVAGVLPVWRLPWGRLGDALRDGGRGAGESVRDSRARRLLVAAEIALTLTVLTGAALLVKSLVRLQTVDPGFRAQGVMSFRLSLPGDPYRDNAKLDAFLTTLEGRLRALPGVTSVAYATSLPPNRLTWSNNYALEGTSPNTQGPGDVAQWINATPDYFATMGIPLKRGRGFEASDRDGALRVAIVSESLARRHFATGDAVGKRFKSGGWNPQTPWTTIVGVVGDVPYERGVWGGVGTTIYLPHAQMLGVRSPFVVMKAGGDPEQLVSAIRQAVLGLDARVPLRDVMSMRDRLHGSTAEPRFRGLLFSLLAGVALLLAITGIYGVMAYYVNQRRRETAIRRALGARPTQVIGAVVSAGLRLTAAGIVLGVIGALMLTRSLAGVLYDVRPRDPGVLAAAAMVLVAAALVACVLPAIRAVRIDPLTILREE